MSVSCLFYCEQVFGTGHLARTLNLIEALVLDHKDFDVSLLLGGKVDVKYNIDPNVGLYELPSIIPDDPKVKFCRKANPIVSEARFAEIQNYVRSLTNLDYLLVEFYPFGRKGLSGYFVYLINLIRLLFPNVKVISYVREILDVHDFQNELRLAAELVSTFDQFFVCGQKSIYEDIADRSVLKLLEDKITYLGYVVPNEVLPTKTCDRLFESVNDVCEIKCVVSIGGGRDGFDVQLSLVECILETIKNKKNICVDVFKGKFHSGVKCDFPIHDSITYHNYSNEFLSCLKNADIHFCMGGYNSVMESLSLGVFPVICPREWETEQLARCRYLEKLGLCYVLSSDNIGPVAVSGVFEKPQRNKAPESMSFSGASRFCELLSLGLPDKNQTNFNVLLKMLTALDLCLKSKSVSSFSSVWPLAVKVASQIDWGSGSKQSLLSRYDDSLGRLLVYLLFPGDLLASVECDLEEVLGQVQGRQVAVGLLGFYLASLSFYKGRGWVSEYCRSHPNVLSSKDLWLITFFDNNK